VAGKFRVGLTSDHAGSSGAFNPADIGLDVLAGHAEIEWEFMRGDSAILTPDDVRGYDALAVFGRRVSSGTFEGADRPTLVARFGVGYDTVDVPACTERGVALTITPDGVRRPMAASYVAFILALGHKLMWMDRITRESRWDERYLEPGVGLQGRVLGLVGMGNIGREVFNLIRPFEMRHIAYDPYVKEEDAAAMGVELVDLDTLMGTADFVCVCCLLNDETYRLINTDRLAQMKETAFLVNAARGPIVDQEALTVALRERRIKGAAIDAFEMEPTDPDDPILSLDNVIVTPHAMGMTDQCFQGIGRSAFASVLEIAAGRVPVNIVNRDVEDHPGFQEKLRAYAARS
jgi:phosphoglycerate dehydrogenase-like enzyme